PPSAAAVGFVSGARATSAAGCWSAVVVDGAPFPPAREAPVVGSVFSVVSAGPGSSGAPWAAVVAALGGSAEGCALGGGGAEREGEAGAAVGLASCAGASSGEGSWGGASDDALASGAVVFAGTGGTGSFGSRPTTSPAPAFSRCTRSGTVLPRTSTAPRSTCTNT